MKLQKITKINELGILIFLIAICIVISAVNPKFYSFINIINILRQTSYIGIIGMAVTMVFITAGLDLSVGSVLGLGGLISAIFMATFGMPVWISVIAGLLTGVFFGLANGLLIVKGKIPSLIVTLGTLYIARGFMNVITQGRPVYPLPDTFQRLGNGTLAGIPYSVIIVAVLLVISHFVLRNTIYGRKIYAVGGNLETSRLSGINVDFIRISVYVLSALMAAFTGILITARMGSGQVSTGTGWELTVIASVIIGGTSMFGGAGTVFGTILGALLMTVMTNGMILMRISAFWQNVFIGAIIIIAVAIDQYKRRRSGDIE